MTNTETCSPFIAYFELNAEVQAAFNAALDSGAIRTRRVLCSLAEAQTCIVVAAKLAAHAHVSLQRVSTYHGSKEAALAAPSCRGIGEDLREALANLRSALRLSRRVLRSKRERV